MRSTTSVVFTAVLLLSMVSVWLAVRPLKVSACLCAPLGSPKEELAGSTAVFAGRVVDIADANERKGPLIGSADPVKVTFQVGKVWKGAVQETLEATTARSAISCGFEFKRAYKYLVYARGTEADLKVSSCTRTRLIIFALQDLDELGEGKTLAVVPEREESSGGQSIGCNTLSTLTQQPLTSPLQQWHCWWD